jgi:hypothetical protein
VKKKEKYCHVSGVPWLITGSGLDDWICRHLHIYTVQGYRQLQRSCYSTHFQFTVIYAPESSVFSSRILATDLSQSHCHFNTHMTSSWHSLIIFLSFPAAANTEDSTQFSFDCCSVLLQLLNSPIPFSNLISLSQSQSQIPTDGQSVSKSWCRAPCGAHDQIFITVLTVTVLSFVGRPLWREDWSVFCICCWLLQRSLPRVRVP